MEHTMSNEQAMRDAFEAWAVQQRDAHDLPYFVFAKNPDGSYMESGAQHAWLGWSSALRADAVSAPVVDETDEADYQPTPESERAAFNAMMRWHMIRMLQAWRYGGDLRASGMSAFEWARSNGVGEEAFKASEQSVKLAAQPTAPVAAVTDAMAWAVFWGIGEMRANSVHLEEATAAKVASEIKSNTKIVPLYPAAQQSVSPGVVSKIQHLIELNVRQTEHLEKHFGPSSELYRFLDAAGGEGYVLGGIDAGSLFISIYGIPDAAITGDGK